MLVVSDKIRVPKHELQFTFARSQGPGGQNVNKVNSKATLRWSVARNHSLPADVKQRLLIRYKNRITSEGELLVTSQRYRDQLRNKEDCLNKLRVLIAAVATAPKKRKLTKPTKGSQLRRRKDKAAQSQKKQLRKPPARD